MAHTIWNPWFADWKQKKGGHLTRNDPTKMEPESACHWPAVLTSWIIFEDQVIPFALHAFPKRKKFKEFTATVEWPPQLSYIYIYIFLPLSFPYRRAVIVMYVGAAWVPLNNVSISEEQQPKCPMSLIQATNIYSYSTWLGKNIYLLGHSSGNYFHGLAPSSITEGGTPLWSR